MSKATLFCFDYKEHGVCLSCLYTFVWCRYFKMKGYIHTHGQTFLYSICCVDHYFHEFTGSMKRQRVSLQSLWLWWQVAYWNLHSPHLLLNVLTNIWLQLNIEFHNKSTHCFRKCEIVFLSNRPWILVYPGIIVLL